MGRKKGFIQHITPFTKMTSLLRTYLRAATSPAGMNFCVMEYLYPMAAISKTLTTAKERERDLNHCPFAKERRELVNQGMSS